MVSVFLPNYSLNPHSNNDGRVLATTCVPPINSILLSMRRSERSTNRYDYKVLSTIGTTEQDKHSLLKQDEGEDSGSQADIDISENQLEAEESLANSREEDIEISALFANLKVNSVADSEESSSDVEESSNIVKSVLTDTHERTLANSVVTAGDDTLGDQHSTSDTNRQVSVSSVMDVNQLTVNESTAYDDITDFLDENEVDDVGDDPYEYESLIKRAKDHRSKFRSIQINL